MANVAWSALSFIRNRPQRKEAKMRRQMNMGVVGMLVASVTACGEQRDLSVPAHGTVRAEIVNGTATTVFQEVGAVVVRATSSDPWRTGGSGTLISPTVFLTAGHLLSIWEGFEMGVTFDPVVTASSQIITAGTWHRHPDFMPTDVIPPADDADMAVFVMDQPVRGITPAKLPTLGFAARYFRGERDDDCDDDNDDDGDGSGPRVLTVGYGVTSLDDYFNGATSAGTRRLGEGRLVGVDVSFGGNPFAPAPGWLTVSADPGT